MLSRRTFITGSAATALCLGFSTARATPARRPLRRGDFEALRDQTFHVRDAQGHGFRCALEGVREGPVAKGLDQFTLVFRRSDPAPLRSDLYELRHEELQRFSLRLEPSSREGAGRFVAVFGQLA